MKSSIHIPPALFVLGQRVLCTWHEAECAPTEAFISSIDYDHRRGGDRPRYTITEDDGARTDDISEGMLSAVVCDDQAAALKRCMSERKEFELRLSSGGLLWLLKIAATQTGRWKRHDLTRGGESNRMKGEDLAWLLQVGHLQESGNWVEVTDQGNALVRDVLAFAQEWEGGSNP